MIVIAHLDASQRDVHWMQSLTSKKKTMSKNTSDVLTSIAIAAVTAALTELVKQLGNASKG